MLSNLYINLQDTTNFSILPAGQGENMYALYREKSPKDVL